jgi:hypothetical protein
LPLPTIGSIVSPFVFISTATQHHTRLQLNFMSLFCIGSMQQHGPRAFGGNACPASHIEKVSGSPNIPSNWMVYRW